MELSAFVCALIAALMFVIDVIHKWDHPFLTWGLFFLTLAIIFQSVAVSNPNITF